MKLTASAISDYLESPKKFYWRYVYRNGGQSRYPGVEPSQPSMQSFSHDLLVGTCWAQFVDEFYRKADATALARPHQRFLDESQGWLGEKVRQQYSDAFIGCMNSYFAQFSPDDGARSLNALDIPGNAEEAVGSELVLENDRFKGTLDGLSHDGVIHECKMTSRAPSQETQLWRIENSIQIKLYTVLAHAKGVRVEFAYKDAPNVVWRAPVQKISDEKREAWHAELDELACGIEEMVVSANDIGEHAFPCHPNGCTLVTKRFVGQCPYRLLCDGDPAAPHFYKERDNDR